MRLGILKFEVHWNIKNLGGFFEVQSWKFAYTRLQNKPYENEVTLTRQNRPLKCCQPFEI